MPVEAVTVVTSFKNNFFNNMFLNENMLGRYGLQDFMFHSFVPYKTQQQILESGHK